MRYSPMPFNNREDGILGRFIIAVLHGAFIYIDTVISACFVVYLSNGMQAHNAK